MGAAAKTNRRVAPGVPDLEGHVPREVRHRLYLAEHHGVPPVPLRVHPEELLHQLVGQEVGVQLADARRENRPGDAPHVAHDRGVQPAPVGPQLDVAQRGPEVVLVRDERENQRGDAAPVDAARGGLVHVPEDGVVQDVNRLRHGGRREVGEQQVDVHAIVYELDDRRVGVGHGVELGDGLELLQRVVKVAEERLPSDRLRAEAEAVDVAVRRDDAQPVRAEREQLCRYLGRLFLRDAQLARGVDPHELLQHAVERLQHPLALQLPLLRLEQVLRAQQAHELGRGLAVAFRRAVGADGVGDPVPLLLAAEHGIGHLRVPTGEPVDSIAMRAAPTAFTRRGGAGADCVWQRLPSRTVPRAVSYVNALAVYVYVSDLGRFVHGGRRRWPHPHGPCVT
ncbi:methyl-accepting chemotaxis protein [Babesia caballi]|uniref:Methyl-accepting chemotaxis protein n=1 Tax=Babesia caballi TaxID=5871 RepID=A0AAV4LR83_BABCB|nr:methyl-accepting chemotaxis protein [Babesia caballi]